MKECEGNKKYGRGKRQETERKKKQEESRMEGNKRKEDILNEMNGKTEN
jgi:hypothetical protein